MARLDAPRYGEVYYECCSKRAISSEPAVGRAEVIVVVANWYECMKVDSRLTTRDATTELEQHVCLLAES